MIVFVSTCFFNSDGKMFSIAHEYSSVVFSLHASVVSSDPEIPLPLFLRQQMKLNEYLTDKEQDGQRAKKRSGEDGEFVSLFPLFLEAYRGISYPPLWQPLPRSRWHSAIGCLDDGRDGWAMKQLKYAEIGKLYFSIFQYISICLACVIAGVYS